MKSIRNNEIVSRFKLLNWVEDLFNVRVQFIKNR